MRELPLHLAVLRAMRQRLESRKRDLEAKCGQGLKDQDYQRTVGRIAELKVALEAVQELMAGGLNLVEDEEAADREQRRAARAADRSARGH